MKRALAYLVFVVLAWGFGFLFYFKPMTMIAEIGQFTKWYEFVISFILLNLFYLAVIQIVLFILKVIGWAIDQTD